MYANCKYYVCWAISWLLLVVSCSARAYSEYIAMPVVVLPPMEQVSHWELAASAGAVIVVVVRPDGCDEHEWPEKLGGVAMHYIFALGLLRKDRGLRLQAPLFAP